MDHKKTWTGKKTSIRTSGPTAVKSGSGVKGIGKSSGLPIDEKQYIGDAVKTIEPTANGPRDQKGY